MSDLKTNSAQIKIFEDKKVRTVWNSEEEEWYFSVIDVIAVLTDSDRPRKYWHDLKKKLIAEGSEVSDKIGQLKMLATDGKMRLTDCLTTWTIRLCFLSELQVKELEFSVRARG